MLGLDYKAANLLSDMLSAPALAWLPPGMRRGALETALAAGKAAASPIRCEQGWPVTAWRPCQGLDAQEQAHKNE
jgi:hypothetical protein